MLSCLKLKVSYILFRCANPRSIYLSSDVSPNSRLVPLISLKQLLLPEDSIFEKHFILIHKIQKVLIFRCPFLP